MFKYNKTHLVVVLYLHSLRHNYLLLIKENLLKLQILHIWKLQSSVDYIRSSSRVIFVLAIKFVFLHRHGFSKSLPVCIEY